MSRHAVRRSLLLAPLSQHTGRLALSVLAIALGVALGYAVQLINHAAISEFAAAVQTLSGEADLAVRGPRAGFDESLYPRLARLPEVAVASPVLEVEVRLPGRRETLRILGLDLFRAARIQPFLAAGDGGERLDFLRPDRIFLSAAASESLGLKKGDALSVQVGLSVLSLQVAGVLGEARRQRFAVVDIGAAQAIFLRSGFLNRIDLRLRPGADAERLAGRLRAEMPPGILVERPDADLERSGALSRALFLSLGILAAVLGSLAPALEAAAAVPAPALKAGDEERALARLQPVWPGIAVLLAGAALTQAGPVSGLPLFGYGAIALLLIGTVMLMPRIAVLGFRVAPLLGPVSARIGLAQLRGAPGQAGVSLAAIVASVSLMVSMAIMVASFRQSLDEWLERVLPADLYLRAGQGSDTAFLSPSDQQAIATLPGVRRAEFLRSQRLLVAPDRPPLTLLARAVEAEGRVPPLLGAAHALKAGEPPAAWVSEVASDLYGWRPGAVIEIPLGGRRARFTVAGIWRDYARQQGAVLIERYEYLRHTGDAYADDAALWLAPGSDAASMTSEIQARVAGGTNLEIAGPGEIREVSLRVFDRTFAVTYALEAVAVAIGLFGLSSSFGALVLARRREFGVLRHIGMTRRQIGSMLAAQGLLVSALGLAVGLTLGWVISLVLIHVVNRQSFHWGMELHLPWRLLAEFVAVMLVLATFTAIASGRQAMSGEAVRAVKEDW